MKKLGRLFVSSLKDKHGEFNFSVIYLAFSAFISLILLIALLYQLQEKSDIQQEYNNLKYEYQELENKGKESILEYENKLSKIKELENQINFLQKESEELNKSYNILLKDFETVNNSVEIYEKMAEDWKYKFETLYNIAYFNYDIINKYNREINSEEFTNSNIENNEDLKEENELEREDIIEEQEVVEEVTEDVIGEEVLDNEVS